MYLKWVTSDNMKFKTKYLKIVIYVITMNLLVFSGVPYCRAETDLDILAPSCILVEPETGKILYEKNADEQRSCASITKIMTLLLVMEAIESGKISLTDNVVASEHAASMGGSDIWLEAGESLTVEEMIKAVVVASANDAAVALAEHISGSEGAFVSQMNQKAADLAMNNTVFKNCNGLDEEGHLTTAYDITLMSRELMKHKAIFNYTSIWIEYLRNGKTQLVNTNKLLKSYKGITGLKTGTTSVAGCCIVATAKRNNLDLVAVVLGDKTGKDRFTDAAALLDYGFANYEKVTPVLQKDALNPIKVINGIFDKVNINVDFSRDILIKKGQSNSITNSIEIVSEVAAPVKKGDKLGCLIYKKDDEIIAQYDVTASESIEQLTFSVAIKKLFSNLIAL